MTDLLAATSLAALLAATRRAAQGIPFLGFRVFPRAIRVSPARWARFRSRHGATLRALRNGRIDEATAAASLGAQIAHLEAFDTLAIRRNYISRLGEGSGQRWREPGEPRWLLGQRRVQDAGGEPRKERPQQPQEQPWLSSLQFGVPREILLPGRGADGAGPRIRALSPDADQTAVLCAGARADDEARWPGGGPWVAAGPLWSRSATASPR